MGCCSGRPTQDPQADSFKSIRRGHSSVKMAQLSSFSSKRVDDPEVEALLTAKSSRNIVFLISKMDSNRVLSEPLEINHAWADNARSVGSVACSYLLLLFIKEAENSSDLDEITQICISEGIVFKIKRNLLSGFQDRIEISILMTLFILEDNEAFKEYLVGHNFSKEIYVYLDKQSPFSFTNKSGMRVASLQIIRTCFAGNKELATEFIDSEKGISNVKELLRENDDYIVLECLYSLDELISFKESGKRDPIILHHIVKSDVLSDLDHVIARCEKELKEHWVVKDLDTYELKKNTLTYARFLKKEILSYKKTEDMVKAIIK